MRLLYLKKPYDVDELIARINKLIKLKHDQDLLKQKTQKLREHQIIFERKLKVWTIETEILQKQFEGILMNVSGNSHSQSYIEQALKTSKKTKNMINLALTFSFCV